jgi:hypothetical protein
MAYNYVKGFHDGIDDETYGNPEGSYATDANLPDTTDGPKYPPPEYWDQRPVALDYYNNLMDNFHDNPFEMDGSLHNVRNMRNLTINSASHVWCNQPTLGGPDLLDQEHRLPPAGRHDAGRLTGALFYNNTMLGNTSATASSNMHWRNNIILPENVNSDAVQRDHEHQLHVVGLQRLRTGTGGTQFTWTLAAVRRAVGSTGAGAHPGAHDAQLRDAGGIQRGDGAGHALACCWATTRSSTCRGWIRTIWRNGTRAVALDGLDFSLRPGSAAIDRGRWCRK